MTSSEHNSSSSSSQTMAISEHNPSSSSSQTIAISEHNPSSSSSQTMAISEHNPSSSSSQAMAISEHNPSSSCPSYSSKSAAASSSFHSDTMTTSQPNSSSSSSFPILRMECKKAIDLFNEGKLYQGLEAISHICNNNPNIGFAHRIHAELCLRAASVMEDPTRSSLEKIAVKLAKTAVTLSPNSLEFAYFYAKLLFQFSHEPVVQESIRALSIKDPTDPTTDDLTNQSPQISPKARNATLRNSLQNHLKQCVNFHGNPLGHNNFGLSNNFVLENNKESVRTPKNQPLEQEIGERLACNRSLRGGTNNTNVRNHENIPSSRSKDTQIAELQHEIQQLENKVRKTTEKNSLDTKRDSGATIMIIGITVFVGFITAIYLSNNCILSEDKVSKIVAASIAGISLFGVLALGRILRTCEVDQAGADKKKELDSVTGDYGIEGETPTGDDVVCGVDLESGSATPVGEGTSKTPFLTTGGRSRSRSRSKWFERFSCCSFEKCGSHFLQTLYFLAIVVVCSCAILYICSVHKAYTDKCKKVSGEW